MLNAKLKNSQENLERKSKRVEKMKRIIGEYRDTTLKLVSNVETELTRLQGMTGDQVIGELGYIQTEVRRRSQYGEELYKGLESSPGKTPYVSPYREDRVREEAMSPEKENMWFDIEKSHERYEEM